MSRNARKQAPKVIKLLSCSAQLRVKFILLINVKMPTIVGILTLVSGINYRFGILTLVSGINYRFWHSKPSILIFLGYFGIYEQFKFYAQLS